MKIKRLLLLFSVFILISISCKKEKNDKSNDVPESFTKKAVLEEFTGEWCGYCPDGAAIIRQLENDKPDEFYAISYHKSDPFEIPAGQSYDNIFNHYGYPGGVVDRQGGAGSRSQWESKVNQALAQTAECGLELNSTLNGNTLKVKVSYAGTSDFDAFLTLAIVEDDVLESSPGAQNGAPVGYKHPALCRAIVTNTNGDPISVKKGKIETKTDDNIDLSNYNINKVHVVAFIHKNITGNQKDIYNAQGVKAGENKDFD